ncbi:MAG TPA: thiamine pyrophosphate-dependent enzyme [Terriglobales bacterium]|nr:thiamine pyrophosphate-dependent enzyme [Terriglobales bacterium]
MGTKTKGKTVQQPKYRHSKTQQNSVVEKASIVEKPKALIDFDTYKRLYSCMLKSRMLEERALGLFRREKAAEPFKQALGQEAMAVGTTIDLCSGDLIAPSDLDFVARIVRNASSKSVFAQALAREGASKKSADARVKGLPEFVVPASTVHAQLAVASGVALGHRTQKTSSVVVALTAGRLTGSASLSDTLRFAGANKLPIIYVVGDSQRSLANSEDDVDLQALAQEFGFTLIPVDGKDAIAVYRVATEAISRARKGVGPTVIECKTSVVDAGSHASRGSQMRRGADPLVYMENYMRKKGAWSDSWKQSLVRQFSKEMDKAVEFAKRNTQHKSAKKRASR